MLTGSGMAIGITWCFAAIVQLVLSWKSGGGGRNDARGLAFALICGMLGISFLFDSEAFAFVAAVTAASQLLAAVIRRVTDTKK
ncbi:hypothetical protein [Anaerotruncus rubiinfantis]|uniref:hypothetical protein n=1 Tax=Anaerotruncus rubiinfantis TaxID=1720200 RepID=UPI00189B6EF0|nr:hypothetical protein [Anaerotruncus rubiinfantis]